MAAALDNSIKGRVLVADDQPQILDALQFLLKSNGYQAEAVTRPAGVLQAVEAHDFDVVLMDLNYTRDTTGGDEGLDLLRQIRAMDETLPLVVMTAWSSVDLAVEAMRVGASDFVQKPWQNRQLLEKLQQQVKRGQAVRKRQRRQDEELREAREIQKNLLPRTMPKIAGYEIAGISQPVRFVGGDYYEVVKISETQTAICIADVAGKGLPAALLMSSLQAALKPLIWDATRPADLCRRLNRILCEITPVGKFITFFYCVLDSRDNRVTYCNAGHNPPMLVRAGGESSELNSSGAVLGQFPDWNYEQGELRLNSNDRLVLFTDGVVEACNGAEEPFGEEQIVHIARQNPAASAVELQTAILKAASHHCDGRFDDDASLIVLRAL